MAATSAEARRATVASSNSVPRTSALAKAAPASRWQGLTARSSGRRASRGTWTSSPSNSNAHLLREELTTSSSTSSKGWRALAKARAALALASKSSSSAKAVNAFMCNRAAMTPSAPPAARFARQSQAAARASTGAFRSITSAPSGPSPPASRIAARWPASQYASCARQPAALPLQLPVFDDRTKPIKGPMAPAATTFLRSCGCAVQKSRNKPAAGSLASLRRLRTATHSRRWSSRGRSASPVPSRRSVSGGAGGSVAALGSRGAGGMSSAFSSPSFVHF